MDMKMVDMEDQRDDRKQLPVVPGVPPRHETHAANKYPNRAMRRRVARSVGVFKRRGAWAYINTGRSKNKPIVKHNMGGLYDDVEPVNE